MAVAVTWTLGGKSVQFVIEPSWNSLAWGSVRDHLNKEGAMKDEPDSSFYGLTSTCTRIHTAQLYKHMHTTHQKQKTKTISLSIVWCTYLIYDKVYKWIEL